METIPKYYIGSVLFIFFSCFILKNIITSRNTKLAIKGKSLKVNLMVIVSALLVNCIYLFIFINNFYFLEIERLDISILKYLGLLLVTLAFVTGIVTLYSMKDSWRVGIRQEQKTELVSSGIFQFSRNPYFLSYILMFLGLFFVFPDLVFLFLYIVMVIIIHLMIRDEEKYLILKHGENYLNYKKQVKRYFTVKLKRKTNNY